MVSENKVSLRPSDMVEGGAVPVDRNLTWEKCSFVLFSYPKKDGTLAMKEDGSGPIVVTAAKINYKDDDSQEFEQHYSVADPERFIPSKDGKSLVAVGVAQAVSKSSNYYVLMSNLVSAGYPENKIGDDLSTLDGLRTYNIGVPEPKRSGLARTPAEGEQARERILSVPSKVISMPGEKKGAKSAKVATAEEQVATDDAIIAKVQEAVSKAVDVGAATRQKVATILMRDKTIDHDVAVKHVFSSEFQMTLVMGGFAIDGENITKVE